MLKFRTKNALFGHFRDSFFKKVLSYLKSAPLNLSNCKILQEKQKYLNIGPKMPYFIFGLFLAWNFRKLLWYLKSAPSNLSNAEFREKMKILGAKMPYLRIFRQEFSKNYCHIWNQHHWICLNAKFCEKMKMPKFGNKNALFEYFWARIFKNYCLLWNHQPQICQTWVFTSYNEFWYRVHFF